jgi:hypothetical protein
MTALAVPAQLARHLAATLEQRAEWIDQRLGVAE